MYFLQTHLTECVKHRTEESDIPIPRATHVRCLNCNSQFKSLASGNNLRVLEEDYPVSHWTDNFEDDSLFTNSNCWAKVSFRSTLSEMISSYECNIVERQLSQNSTSNQQACIKAFLSINFLLRNTDQNKNCFVSF